MTCDNGGRWGIGGHAVRYENARRKIGTVISDPAYIFYAHVSTVGQHDILDDAADQNDSKQNSEKLCCT